MKRKLKIIVRGICFCLMLSVLIFSALPFSPIVAAATDSVKMKTAMDD